MSDYFILLSFSFARIPSKNWFPTVTNTSAHTCRQEAREKKRNTMVKVSKWSRCSTNIRNHFSHPVKTVNHVPTSRLANRFQSVLSSTRERIDGFALRLFPPPPFCSLLSSFSPDKLVEDDIREERSRQASCAFFFFVVVVVVCLFILEISLIVGRNYSFFLVNNNQHRRYSNVWEDWVRHLLNFYRSNDLFA